MKENEITVSEKKKGFSDILYDFFRSLKLTISLLILLAVLSIIGTLIKQNAPSMEYIQRYGVSLYNVLDFFNLFDMFHSWWFSAILLLLVFNLIACSLHRFPSVWRQISRKTDSKELKDSMLKALPYVERIRPEGKEEEFQARMKKWFKKAQRVESESFFTLYGEKGRFSRLGVYLTHLSVLIILIGGLAGSIYGYRGFVNILEGETVDHIYSREKDQDIPKPIGFSIRCDDFNISYYDLPGTEKHVKEYSSNLSVLENGKEVLKKTIKVNHPLHYRGLSFYQSSYGSIRHITLGIQEKGKGEKIILKASEGEDIPIPGSNAFIRVLKYVPQIHNLGEGVQMILLRPNQAPQPFWVLKNESRSKPGRENDGVLFTLEEVAQRDYTGLQVTKDPGVWIVWVGCGLMVLGLIISFFFSHQKVWVRFSKKPGGEIVLAGATNKNRVGFEKKFKQLAEEVRNTIKFQ